jgi:hypothetical protein
VAAGGAEYRALDVLDDVDQVFEVAGATDEPVEVVEDHPVDGTAGEVGQELAELGTEHDPVDGSVILDDLALLERGGVVLLVDLHELGPAQSLPSVVGVLLLTVDAGLETEAVGGDAQVRRGPLGDVGGEVVVEAEGHLPPAGLYGHLEVVPHEQLGGGHCSVSSPDRFLSTPGTFLSFGGLAVLLTW